MDSYSIYSADRLVLKAELEQDKVQSDGSVLCIESTCNQVNHSEAAWRVRRA